MKTKRLRNSLLLIVALGVPLMGGSYAGYREYVSLRQAHLIKEARVFLDKSMPRKALLCLQRTLQYDPADLEACRLMAELAESLHAPGAIMWRRRVVELNPASVSDRLVLAQIALSFRDYVTATNALAGVSTAGKKTAAYHDVAGTVAAAASQFAQAEAHFLAAAKLDPQNPLLELNLAVVRLHITNAAVRAKARVTLKRLSSGWTNSPLRCGALRALTVDALRRQQTAEALVLSEILLREAGSTFDDRLLRLQVLQASRSPWFAASLVALQREAEYDSTNATKVYTLGLWQMANDSPAGALAWLRRLPPDTQTNQPVAKLIGKGYLAMQDWNGLQSFLDRQNWGELEFLRFAFLTRAFREQSLDGAAKGEWELALKAAAGQKANLIILLRWATTWKWQTESEDLLWTIVNQYPGEKWAFQWLNQVLMVNGRTRPLMLLYSQELKRSPANLSIKNNLAMTAMLLDVQELNPYALAREVYEKSPTNSAYASTYAFSLHQQKKDREALKVLRQLPPQDLDEPTVAGYYGLILRATGDQTKARVYFRLASKALLLPEEKKLFTQARRGV